MCRGSFDRCGCGRGSQRGACCSCGCSPCSCGSGFQRRFSTVEEDVEELEGYIKELEKEIEGAKRELKDLTGK